MQTKYNFQQRISWLSHRWRTQRNAISNVNCRIQWIIESLNAPCAPWYSEEHACLSVIMYSTPLIFYKSFELDLEVLYAGLHGSAPLKCISWAFAWCNGVIIIFTDVTSDIGLLLIVSSPRHYKRINPFGGKSFLTLLTSNQVGLPAELKHINKRRKRN